MSSSENPSGGPGGASNNANSGGGQDNLMAAMLAGGDDPVHGDTAPFNAGNLRDFQAPPANSSENTNTNNNSPSAQVKPLSRTGAPKGMDAGALGGGMSNYDPYSYKAFSPSALPPSPAMVQDGAGNTMQTGLPGIPMGGATLGAMPDPNWSPEQLAHYHAVQAQIAASLAGPQAMAAIQQSLYMGLGNTMPMGPSPASGQYYTGPGGGGPAGFSPDQQGGFYDTYPPAGGGGGRGRGRGRGGRGRGGHHHSHPQHHGNNPGPYSSEGSSMDRIHTADSIQSGGPGPGGEPQDYRGGAPNIRRSPALLEFHNSNGTAFWELERVFGLVGEFCKDQEGSRFIQRKLDEGCSDQQVTQLLQEIVDAGLEDIVGDVFGNYVVQKIVELASPSIRELLCKCFDGMVVTLTLQTFGCRVIQRCIEVFPPEWREMVFRELEGNVALCVQDQNGNHVIQKCVEIDPVRSNFIVESFRGMVKELATHAYGCRVIQCVLQYHPQSEPSILAEMQPFADVLATDQFGNYVMQHVIEHCHSAPAADMVALLASHFYRFALHKFASNVVEKLYKRAGPPIREQILNQLMMPCSDPAQLAEVHELFANEQEAMTTPPISYLYCLIKDRFGNYVMQSMCDVATEDQIRRIITHVQPYHHLLRQYLYGKHIVARLVRVANGGTASAPHETGGGHRGGGGRGRGGRGGPRGGRGRGYGGDRGGGGGIGLGPNSGGQGGQQGPSSSGNNNGGGNGNGQSFTQHQQQFVTACDQSSHEYLSPSKEEPW